MVCGNCGHENVQSLSKYEAVFFDSLRQQTQCKKCGSSRAKSSFRTMPNIDKEILSAWIKNKNLFFSNQDENLIMASIPAVLIIEAHAEAASARKRQLLGALLVKLHDEVFSCPDERKSTVEFLMQHQPRWKKASVGYIVKGVRKKLDIN